MDWIFDNFQIVFLIAIVIGSLVKRLLESKAGDQEQQDDTFDPREIFGPDERWEPVEDRPSSPPPLVRTVPPPLMHTAAPLQAQAEDRDAAALKRQQEIQERLRQIKETKANTTGRAAETNARVSAARNPIKPQIPAKTGIKSSLRSPHEIRRAFVLREILGPPVSLR
jgi:hypothetical protein